MQMSQEKQQKSTTSSERKDRIIDSLFLNRLQTVVTLNVFRGLLGMFQGYVKSFQAEKPLIHTLHSRMVEIIEDLLGMFIKPEYIPDKVGQLLKLNVTDLSIQKADKNLGVGKYAYTELSKARLDKACHHWVSKLYENLRTGYVMAAKKILQMPIANKTIRILSVLDPHFVGHSQTENSFKIIAKKLPQVFTADELGQLSVDVARYNVDQQVKQFASDYKEEDPIDTGFWKRVFSLQSFNQVKYPALKKLVTSVLTIFSGPLIESTFNIMDDIVEKDRTKMTVINYEAVAIVKTALRKKNVKSTNMKVSANMKKACISAYQTYKEYVKQIKEEKQRKHEENLKASVQLLKQEKAKRVSKLLRLKNKMLLKKQKEAPKRKLSHSNLEGGSKQKKAKVYVD
ncbi:uncharacterized protein LOC132720200 [Ruditapes philippinarum]|uniref:uncharacterized protein LOC132720200 n=1 Tax=Ruditapes philippinarum TaxID=129788 RepID=UPI00295A9A2D|nr:uncharacterized protein LOC132720200 [Ruditapes philippinarum]